MANNVLGAYDPEFFAQEALIWLQKNLKAGATVYRGYDPAPQQKGSVITIRRPMTFTATDMPSASTPLVPEDVSLTLDKWKGVTFDLTDKELSHTKEQIINEHLGPALYATADAIDQSVIAKYKDVPWFGSATSPLAVADITAARKRLFQNGAPMNDGRLSLMLSPTLEEEALRQSAFTQQQGSGDVGVRSQVSGILGPRYGFSNVFASQNAPTHTGGTNSDTAGAVVGAHAVGVTSLSIDSISSSGTVVAGDTLVIAGDTQRYAVTSGGTASGGAITLGITPALKVALSGSEVVTTSHTSGEQSLAYHRDWCALAMAPLSDMGNQLGAMVKSMTDPNSGLSIRVRMWYEGSNAKVFVGVDALWGVKTLNPNLAYRLVD